MVECVYSTLIRDYKQKLISNTIFKWKTLLTLVKKMNAKSSHNRRMAPRNVPSMTSSQSVENTS